MRFFPGGPLFSAPSPPAIIPAPLPPSAADVANSPEERARREAERKNRLRRSGLGATRLTSPNLGDDESNVQQTTLGGG